MKAFTLTRREHRYIYTVLDADSVRVEGRLGTLTTKRFVTSRTGARLHYRARVAEGYRR